MSPFDRAHMTTY